MTTRLSPRQQEVLTLIWNGHTNKEIAAVLCVSVKTIQMHRAILMRKWQCHNVAGLMKKAVEMQVVVL